MAGAHGTLIRVISAVVSGPIVATIWAVAGARSGDFGCGFRSDCGQDLGCGRSTFG